MTIELVKILESAKEAHDRSMYYFELSDNEPTDEMRNLYWTLCRAFDGKCRGLLQAYEILTGKEVWDYAIDEELAQA